MTMRRVECRCGEPATQKSYVYGECPACGVRYDDPQKLFAAAYEAGRWLALGRERRLINALLGRDDNGGPA